MLDKRRLLDSLEQKLDLVDTETQGFYGFASTLAFTRGAHWIVDFVKNNGDVHIEEIEIALNELAKGKK